MKTRGLYMQFILRVDRCKNGEAPVAVRLFTNGRQKVRHTGMFVRPDDWNSAKQRAVQNHELNYQLSELENRYRQFLLMVKGECNLEYCMAFIFDEVITSASSVLQFVESFWKEQAGRNDVSPSTKSRYRLVASLFARFLRENGHISLSVSAVNERLIAEWDQYLHAHQIEHAGKRLGHNTLIKYHSMVRTMFLAAYNRRLVDRNPYATFPLKMKPANRPFLSEQELQTLLSIRFEEMSLEKIRLIFLFSCFTGIRFKDAQRLSPKDLQQQNDGCYISFVVSKTGKQQVIPLLQVAKDILEQMAADFGPELAIRDRLLPRISNQKFNKNLKLLASRLGIAKNLSHHVARHSFATTMLNRGVKLEALQSLLGHSNFRETQLYARISPAYLRQELNGIGQDYFKLNP